jgi:photosystem II stability/assembly factor-like uncharacterized protein
MNQRYCWVRTLIQGAFFASLMLSLTLAQTLDMELFPDMNPRNIGPAGMSGRVTSIDVVTQNPDVMYVGSASGGLWKSTSGGIDWSPIFTEEATASIGAVTIQQSNPSVVWVGTGEGNPRNSLNGGYGVYKTLDGGGNWKLMGLELTRHIHRIVIDPTNPDVVYVAAIGSPWGEHPERGVYKTTDGGETWDKILYVSEKVGASDLVIDPSNPQKLMAAMWEHRRWPWSFTSGGPGSGLYITHDGGKTWEKRTAEDGLPKGDLGRIGLAIAPSKPEIVYALIESKKNALYQSTDGGFSWRMVNDKPEIGNRPFYYSDIFVDPKNENRLYSVFTYVNVSEDGGQSFEELMPAYGVNNGVHPDHHAWWIHPEDPSFMMEGNDGGLNITYDGGKTWRFVSNLPVGQFYHVAVDDEIPYNVYGGMQDNGSWGGPAYVWKSQGIRNHYWQELAFGDGFDVVPDPENARYGYAMSQQGYVVRYDRETGSSESLQPTSPDPKENLRFNWNAAIAQDPFDPNTIYFGSQYVHQSPDEGRTWEIISPDLTTNDSTKQQQSESGGLTLDATGAENHTTILVVEPSPVAQGLLWVSTDDGRLHLTRDGGETWTSLEKKLPGFPAGAWIPQVKASNKSAGTALVVVNDYRRFNHEPYAYRTTDYGQTWERIVDAEDVATFTVSIVEDPEEANLLFLGTDDGLYVSLDGAQNWTKWTHGFPTVQVSDLVIHPREHDLVIGTFGRSFWVLDDIRPLRAMAAGEANMTQPLALFEPPTAYLAENQQPAGSRFGADALFNGDNRRRGAMISYWAQAPEKKKEEPEKGEEEPEVKADSSMGKVTWDSITLQIYANDDQLIRTLKWEAPSDSGLHRAYWGLDEAGPDYVGREPRTRPRRGEPGGVNVLPGTYTLTMTYGDQTATQQIEVALDPRIEYDLAGLQARYEALKTLEGYREKANHLVQQLVDSKGIAEGYVAQLKKLDAKAYAADIKASKAMVDTLDIMLDRYFGKEDDRQGITRNDAPTVSGYIFGAMGYVNTRPGAPTATEDRLMGFAKEALNELVAQVNGFFSSPWAEYRSRMEALQLSPFEDIEAINAVE